MFDQYADLKQICKILKRPYEPINEEIAYIGDVRLIDEKSGKLIGIYPIAEARKLVKGMKTDMIMVNNKVKPAICKTYNSREDLYGQFIEKIVKKDSRLCKGLYVKFSREIPEKG